MDELKWPFKKSFVKWCIHSWNCLVTCLTFGFLTNLKVTFKKPGGHHLTLWISKDNSLHYMHLLQH